MGLGLVPPPAAAGLYATRNKGMDRERFLRQAGVTAAAQAGAAPQVRGMMPPMFDAQSSFLQNRLQEIQRTGRTDDAIKLASLAHQEEQDRQANEDRAFNHEMALRNANFQEAQTGFMNKLASGEFGLKKENQQFNQGTTREGIDLEKNKYGLDVNRFNQGILENAQHNANSITQFKTQMDANARRDAATQDLENRKLDMERARINAQYGSENANTALKQWDEQNQMNPENWYKEKYSSDWKDENGNVLGSWTDKFNADKQDLLKRRLAYAGQLNKQRTQAVIPSTPPAAPASPAIPSDTPAVGGGYRGFTPPAAFYASNPYGGMNPPATSTAGNYRGLLPPRDTGYEAYVGTKMIQDVVNNLRPQNSGSTPAGNPEPRVGGLIAPNGNAGELPPVRGMQGPATTGKAPAFDWRTSQDPNLVATREALQKSIPGIPGGNPPVREMQGPPAVNPVQLASAPVPATTAPAPQALQPQNLLQRAAGLLQNKGGNTGSPQPAATAAPQQQTAQREQTIQMAMTQRGLSRQEAEALYDKYIQAQGA